MRVFLSHSSADLEIAQALRLRLDEISPTEIKCSLLADDIFPSDDWEAAIRKAASECDAIACLVSPAYVDRPWFHTEWATFWFQQKPWYILLHDVDIEQIFEPMRRRQFANLSDRRSVERFISGMPASRRSHPPDLLAAEIVSSVKTASDCIAEARLESNLAELAVMLTRGTRDVNRGVVEAIVQGGGTAQAVNMALSSGNWVAMRQMAVFLLTLDLPAEAESLAARIGNRAERRTVAVCALERIFKFGSDSDLLDLVFSVYRSVRDPQRRDIREAADGFGMDIKWPTVESAP